MRIEFAVSRPRALAIAVVSGVSGAALGGAVALWWAQQGSAQQAAQLRASASLAQRYAQDWARMLAGDVFADRCTSPAQSEPVASTAHPDAPRNAREDTRPEGLANAREPAQPKAAVGGDTGHVPVVRLSSRAASIARLQPGAVQFASGSTYRVGDVLPSGAKLLAVDPEAARVVTDRRVIVLTDYGAKAAAPVGAPAVAQKPAEQSVQVMGAQAPASPSSMPAHTQAATPSVASGAPEKPQATSSSSAGAPAAAAPTSAVAMEAGKPVFMVTPEQANVAGMDAASVRFRSGRIVRVGETFATGERLEQLVPSQGKIVTDRRVIYLKIEAGTS